MDGEPCALCRRHYPGFMPKELMQVCFKKFTWVRVCRDTDTCKKRRFGMLAKGNV